ncbi:hypothetical protein B0H17DRAFT_168789 [Mycena rosella]|uniref:Uncharacterized protein n=1 Tax=Mycena rosella TaxID=1033263 RepID=A0AAD7D2H4_MYCRO|nr:hypothetical protein B0H17DRAFT_168789 [Mycena rosella]
METCRPAPKHEDTAAESENTTETSTTSTTEAQLVVLLSESRREAESLRQELAAVRRKADADHRRLQSLLESSSNPKSPEIQVHAFQERIARAEAALDEAETRSRIVESNWVQVDRYLSAIQRQAADSRTAFSRIIAQNDGQLVLPNQSLPALRREIPLRDYISSSGSAEHTASSSDRLRRHSSSTSFHSPREHVRSLPLLIPRGRPSSPFRSPSELERAERWDGGEEDTGGPPPYKRQRASASGRSHDPERVFRPRSPRGPSPPPQRRPSVVTSSSPPIPRKRDADRGRHPSREHMPPPPSPSPAHRPPRPLEHRTPGPYREATIARAYDARNPPLQIIQHQHPSPPPPAPLPPPPPPAPSPGGVPHQYQHRFHLGAGAYPARRLVRPGAYETVVFALDSGTQPYGGKTEGT